LVVFQSLEDERELVEAPGMAWSRIPPAERRVFGVGLGVVGWLFVENCTVDASIFVVKLSRANGGCLGTRSR
jgi:hypothetical protein